MKNRQKFSAARTYLISPFIVMSICLTIFALKGIYPFGDRIIDVWDMTQMNVPLYYHLWDFLHGNKDLFFDWYTGLSVNMAESVGIVSLISPFNLFFFFIPRENIHLSMGLFTMFKFMGSSVTMYFFLKKNFKVSAFWLNSFSVSYAFSGYAVMYYSNSQWIDIMAIFPLLMHSLRRLFRGRKGGTLSYIIALAACLIINMYISMMILLFIFLTAGFYFIFISKFQRKRLIYLGTGTLMAAAISAVLIVPCYIQIDASARSTLSSAFWYQYIAMMSEPDGVDINKWFLLFPCALPLAIVITGIFKDKKSKSGKRIAAFWSCGILLVALPLFFETTNLIWHGGGYVLFPVRFGFILTFMVIASACYYISRKPADECLNVHEQEKPDITEESVIGRFLNFTILFSTIFVIIFLAYTTVMETLHFHENNPYVLNPELLLPSVVISVILFCMYMLLLSKFNTKINYRAAGVLLLLEIFCFSYIYIGYNDPPFTYVREANEVKKEFDISADRLGGIKTMGHSLNSNYPFILERFSISNWTHSIPYRRLSAIEKFGYSNVYTRMLDTGGTVFSDALFNVRNTLSVTKNELEPEIYNCIAFGEGYNYYENKYTLPFGIPVNSDSLKEIIISENGLPESDKETKEGFKEELQPNPFRYTNEVYAKAFSKEEKLLDIIKHNNTIDEKIVTAHHVDGNTLSMSVKVVGKKVLYYAPVDDSLIGSHFVVSSSVTNPDRKVITTFPTQFDHAVLCLGVFENEIINLDIRYVLNSSREVNTSSITNTKASDEIGTGIIALLDLEAMSALTEEWADFNTNASAGKRTLSLSANSFDENHDLLFLPVSYDKGWDCKVNGKKVKPRRILGSFIGVPIRPGENNIKMSFTPPGMFAGLLVSLSASALLAAFLLISKKFRLSEQYKERRKTFAADFKKAEKDVFVIYMMIWLGFITVIYIVPIGVSLISEFLLT